MLITQGPVCEASLIPCNTVWSGRPALCLLVCFLLEKQLSAENFSRIRANSLLWHGLVRRRIRYDLLFSAFIRSGRSRRGKMNRIGRPAPPSSPGSPPRA